MPIDLDEWWAKRFLANIDKLSWHSSGTPGSWRTVRSWDLKQDSAQRTGSPTRWRCDGLKCHDVIWIDGQRWDANKQTNHRESHHLNSTIHPTLNIQSVTGWTLSEDILNLSFYYFSQQRCHVTLKCSKIVFSRRSVFASFLMSQWIIYSPHRSRTQDTNISINAQSNLD